METKSKKRVSNIIMIILIAVIAFSGIMAVGSIKGWFGNSDSDSAVTTHSVSGVASIERSGVGYSLKENVPLEVKDIVQTKNGSEASLEIAEKNTLTMNENTELKILSNKEDNIHIKLMEGEFFADTPKAGKRFTVDFGESTAKITGTVFSISNRQGSSSLNVYEGEVKVTVEDGSEKAVRAGEVLSIAHSGDGTLTAEVMELKAESLNEFLINKAKECDSKDKLCFSASKLQKILDKRATETAKAQKEAEAADVEAINSNSKNSSASGSNAQNSETKSCTITIHCDTILKNMGNLTPGKNKYVPGNGCILATSTVEFADGETVFDVLKRACSYTGIQLEYSYTPMYGSYYIEGINNLYEFDCGNESGWMYKVNGWFPNYGCSSYKLKNGDNIVWCYTCNGLGADVGGSVY